MTSYWTFPAWTANTAYAAYAIVTPSPPDGTVQRITTAGTSGNTQPTWATGAPWTTADGTCIWSRGTTFRQDVNAGIATVLLAFAAANPTLLRKVYTERPPSLAGGELPAAWIDSQPEIIGYSSGVRQRTQAPIVGIADVAPDAEEFSDRINYLTDALIDAFTAAYHAASATSILEVTGVSDIDIPESTIHLSGVSLILSGAISEGRT